MQHDFFFQTACKGTCISIRSDIVNIFSNAVLRRQEVAYEASEYTKHVKEFLNTRGFYIFSKTKY